MSRQSKGSMDHGYDQRQVLLTPSSHLVGKNSKGTQIGTLVYTRSQQVDWVSPGATGNGWKLELATDLIEFIIIYSIPSPTLNLLAEVGKLLHHRNFQTAAY